MRTRAWQIVGAAFVWGCSAASASKAAPEVDAGILIIPRVDASASGKDASKVSLSDTGVDSGPACASPDASPLEPCGTLSWAVSPVAARPRNHHVTLAYETASGGTLLYAVGGVNADYPINNVDRVPLNADGTLGTWVADQALPYDVGGLVGEIVSGVLVVAGGNTLSGYTDAAFASVLNADGSLAGWKDAPVMNEPRMHAGSITRGETMWIMGGFNEDTEWNDIISTTVSPDGTVAPWQPAGTLPDTMSHFTVNLVGDDIYLTGGLDSTPLGNPPDLDTTWHGKIQADGTLGGWVAGPTLPVAEATHGAFVYGGYLTICGGINDVPAEEDRCWRAPIQADRSLGAFEEIATMPLGRGHVHQLPVVGLNVYSVAGAIDFNLDSTSDVFVGSFDTKSVTGKRTHRDTPAPSAAVRVPKCHVMHR